MYTSTRQIHRLSWLVILVAVAACKSNNVSRIPVRGNVICDGAPVARGTITFRPASGSKGPAAGTAIVDGEFAVGADRGPTAGPHDVEIKIASFEKGAAKPGEPALAMRGNLLFKSFFQQVDVSSEKNEFHFSLTSEVTPTRH